MLREIFGPKTDEVTGDWIKSRNEGLNDTYSSKMLLGLGNRVGWDARGTRHLKGVNRIAYRVLVGNLMGRDSLENPGVDGNIINKF